MTGTARNCMESAPTSCCGTMEQVHATEGTLNTFNSNEQICTKRVWLRLCSVAPFMECGSEVVVPDSFRQQWRILTQHFETKQTVKVSHVQTRHIAHIHVLNTIKSLIPHPVTLS